MHRRAVLLGAASLVACHDEMLLQFSRPMIQPTGLIHGQPYTVYGSGFGTKSSPWVGGASPIIRDIGADASVGSLSPQWNGQCGPTLAAVGPVYCIQNNFIGFRPTTSVIGAPHPYIFKIISACLVSGSGGGITMSCIFPNSTTMQPYVWYGSWYERCDPDFTFNLSATPDNNFKMWSWSMGDGPSVGAGMYTGFNNSIGEAITGITQGTSTVVTVANGLSYSLFDTTYVYATTGMTEIDGIGVLPSAKTATTVTLPIDSTGFSPWISGGVLSQVGVSNNQIQKWFCGYNPDVGIGLIDPDAAGHGHTGNKADSPFYAANGLNGWIRKEVEYLVTSVNALPSAGGGYINQYDDCQSILFYKGPTDAGATTPLPNGSDRCIGFGDYCRNYPSTTNWRFFSDFYVDMTSAATSATNVARVVVGNASKFNNCTIREPSIPISWADGSITFTFWKGGLATNSIGYIYVIPEIGGNSNGDITPISAGSALIA
jgi:hypothetical protein